MKSLFPNDRTAIFKVNNQHPSDILRFQGWQNLKKHRGSFKFCCPTLAEVYLQQNLIQDLSPLQFVVAVVVVVVVLVSPVAAVVVAVGGG